jgi:Protein of unknown function (DUF1566)
MKPPVRSAASRGARRFGRAGVVALGASVALVALRGRADPPAGWYQIQRGTVFDTKTRLTWQQAVAPGTYDQQGAAAYCAGLTLNRMGGFRVPSQKELYTLVDETREGPAIDLDAFPNVAQAEEFWSSSIAVGGQGFGWTVRFDVGDSQTEAPTAALSVRCVR